MNAHKSLQQCVILLHGLARTHLSMMAMEKALQRNGYQVVNVNYPSRALPIDQLARIAIEHGLKGCEQQNHSRVHFVTHSLGGILVRNYLQLHEIPGLHRVVMMGPPNQGSEVVDRLKDFPGYRLFNGPAGQQLGTANDDLPRQLGPVDFELGVIAGKRSVNLVLSSMMPSPNDGKVSVSSTQIEGMTDFITLPVTHTFMMLNPNVIRQTLYFLKHGHFDQHRV
jgi:pimeloyl-ACP methyl ester carboxylesterase